MNSPLFEMMCEEIRNDPVFRAKMIQGNGPHGTYKSHLAKDAQAYAIAFDAIARADEKPPSQPFSLWHRLNKALGRVL